VTDALELANETPFAARFWSGGIGEGKKGGWVVARASFRLQRGGNRLRPTREPWPVLAAPLETEHGVFPADGYPFRRGCDLVIAGTAVSPTPVSAMTVSARVGDFTSELLVIGDRRWRKTVTGELVATDPEPFTEMRLDWTRAYGGTAELGGEPAPHALNPQGRGYYLTAKAALEQPLPNLEDPAAAVRSWEDQPLPVSWYPVANAPSWRVAAWGMERSRRSAGRPTLAELGALAFDCFPGASPPAMILPSLEPRTAVEVHGLRGGPLAFRVPRLDLQIVAQVGAETIARPLAYCGLWLLPQRDLVVLSCLGRFKYALRAQEKRAVRLVATS
jgi:hypothetical protein